MPGVLIYLLRLLPLLLCHIATLWTPSARAASARLLIYSATEGFRHADSIPAAIDALKREESSIDATFDATENASEFNDANLQNYDALVFLSTTGKVLNNDELQAFQRYINAGGNFVGIHAASDALKNSRNYIHELGSHFVNHLSLRTFTLNVLEPDHPSVSMLPSRWSVSDEPYNFDSDPRSLGAKVVLAADESTYTDGNRKNHPIAWYQEKGAGVEIGGTPGRSFYTALGHKAEFWEDRLFISHVLGGISWVLESNTTRASNPNAQVGNP